MTSPRGWISRRRFLAHGLAGTSAAVVGSLAGPSTAGAVNRRADGQLVAAAVDLTIDLSAASLVTGTVNGIPVNADGSVYGGPRGGPATVIGSLAGRPLEAILTRRDQVPHGSGYETTARVTASVGDSAFVASGTFRLDARYEFVDGTIRGRDRGLAIDVDARPDSASGDIGYGAKLHGTFGEVPVRIAADLDPARPGSVVGSWGSHQVNLRVHPYVGGTTATRVVGNYGGPAELLALIVGAIAYFVA